MAFVQDYWVDGSGHEVVYEFDSLGRFREETTLFV